MTNKMICVVYVESDNEVRYVTITDLHLILEVLELNRTSFNLYTDEDFPSILSTALITAKWIVDFPHDDYASVENPSVITVYF